MRKLLLLSISLLYYSSNINAQNNKFSIDVNAPVLIGDNFISDNYKGNIDIGAKLNYKF